MVLIPLVEFDSAFDSTHLGLGLGIVMPVLILALFLPVRHPARIVDRVITLLAAIFKLEKFVYKSGRGFAFIKVIKNEAQPLERRRTRWLIIYTTYEAWFWEAPPPPAALDYCPKCLP